MSPKRFILGSASARRKKILEDLGVRFSILVPKVDEVFHADAPRRTAQENALHKGNWCRQREPAAHILTADTIVAFEGRCVTKPASPTEAARFLSMFSGKPQVVYTALALAAPGSPPEVHVIESGVLFKTLTREVIRLYLERVNPLDKAGAYDIDQSGDLIIESYTGSYTNIMGLPRETVSAWLTRQGFL